MKSAPISNGLVGASTQYNALRDDARGGAAFLAHNSLGILTISVNPTNGQTWTITINGTAISGAFVSSIGVTAGNVLIGASAKATITNLVNLLQNPQQTTSTQVALSIANQLLVSYVCYSLGAGVSAVVSFFSFNTTMNLQLTSFSVSTTATGVFVASPMKLFVEAGILYVGITQVVFNGNFTPAFVAPVSNPRIDILTIDNTGTLAITQGSESASPVAPTYPTNKLVICEVYNVVGETQITDNANQLAGQGYILKDARGFTSVFYIADNSQIAAGVIQASNLANAGTCATGSVVMWATKAAPAGWLMCDGSAVSRATYATLFSTIAPSLGAFTVTIASPAVFTLNGHGLVAGDPVYFTTTGALPTGLSANTLYYVISAGLTANAFEVSATPGGSAINTSGSQSGTHTAVYCPFGLGDGSTTFNLPNMQGNVPVGVKSGDANFGNIGETGGEETHVLSSSEMPAHTHSGYKPGVSSGILGDANPQVSVDTTTGSAGGGAAHNNLQPYLTLNFIVKT